MKVLAWMLICGVATWDVLFMARHCENVMEWELNPVARWLFEMGGIQLVAGFRAGGVLALMISCHLAGGKWGKVGLAIGILSHLILLMVYLF